MSHHLSEGGKRRRTTISEHQRRKQFICKEEDEMSLKTLETKWKKALTSSLAELEESEYKKLLFSLGKIPKSLNSKSREEMPQTIIEKYGAEKSILEINKAMKELPRMDHKVQGLLQPCVEKLKILNQKKNQQKVAQPVKKKKTSQTQSSTKTTAGRAASSPAQSTNQKNTKKKTSQTQSSTKTTAGRAASSPAQSTNQKKRKISAVGPVETKQTKKQKKKRKQFDCKEDDEMSLETRWREALTSILEELDDSQFRKLLFSLDKIPKSLKSKSREEMPQIIIEKYGVEESINEIDAKMEELPRSRTDAVGPVTTKQRQEVTFLC
ncbi:uncharacterized protein AKAME5_002302400 [Lates japonicus]|uniref:Uncharacterized protein n=1 Tax=Lates japonicus TaxID=270547 RepID=A0AAD3RKA9_LATJO|nr:uncharacterized protein AKAME5_002302400 [Lates japonicus]